MSEAPYRCSVYGFVYLSLDDIVNKSFNQIEDFKEEFCIPETKLKHVKDRLFLHYFFTNIMEYVRSIKIEEGLRVVLYITEKKLSEKEFKDPSILKQLKTLKKLLPLPFIIPLKESLIKEKAGDMLEINKKCLEFYSKRKVKLKQIKKYFDDKGYTTLTSSLSNIVNLKGFYY